MPPGPIDGAWLRRWHDQHPGATSRAFGRLTDRDGRTSYARLAAHAGDGDRVLDLACGDGRLLEDVLLHRPAQAVGIDQSPGELGSARRRLSGTVELVEGPVQRLPFDDEGFDIVLCHLALMLFDDLEGVLREVHRVLAPLGSFAVVLSARGERSPAVAAWGEELRARTFADTTRIIDPRPLRGELPAMLADAGFRAVEVRPFALEGRPTIEQAWAFFADSYDPAMLSEADLADVERGWRARVAPMVEGGALRFRLPMQEVVARV